MRNLSYSKGTPLTNSYSRHKVERRTHDEIATMRCIEKKLKRCRGRPNDSNHRARNLSWKLNNSLQKHPEPLSPNHGSVLHLLLYSVSATLLKVKSQRMYSRRNSDASRSATMFGNICVVAMNIMKKTLRHFARHNADNHLLHVRSGRQGCLSSWFTHLM